MGLEPVAKVRVSQWLDYDTWRRELGAAIFYVPRGLRKEDWGKGDRGRACPPPGPSSDPSCGLVASLPLASRGPPSRLVGDCPLLLKLAPAADWRLLPKEARASGPRGRRAPGPLVRPWVRLLLSCPPFHAGSILPHRLQRHLQRLPPSRSRSDARTRGSSPRPSLCQHFLFKKENVLVGESCIFTCSCKK